MDCNTGIHIDRIQYGNLNLPCPFLHYKEWIYGVHCPEDENASISTYSIINKTLVTFPIACTKCFLLLVRDGVLYILVEEGLLCFLIYSICNDGGIRFKKKFFCEKSPRFEIHSTFSLENYTIVFGETEVWVLSLQGRVLFECPSPEWSFVDCWVDEMYTLNQSGVLSTVKLG